MSEWHSLNEKKPPYYTPLLIWRPKEKDLFIANYRSIDWILSDNTTKPIKGTEYWQEPQPPETEG